MHTHILYIFSVQGGATALHFASFACQAAVVTLLLNHGANVHAVNEVGDCSTRLGVFGIHNYVETYFKALPVVCHYKQLAYLLQENTSLL